MIGILAIAVTAFAVFAFYRASSLRMTPYGSAQDSGDGPGPGPGPAPDLEGKLEALWRAIGKAEGYFLDDPTVIPRRAHNPCDLVKGDIGLGTAGKEKVTIYPTDQDGIDACKRQLRLILLGQSTRYPVGISFRQLARTWIFGNRDLTILEEQAAFHWARTVAQSVGAMVDASLDDWRNA